MPSSVANAELVFAPFTWEKGIDVPTIMVIVQIRSWKVATIFLINIFGIINYPKNNTNDVLSLTKPRYIYIILINNFSTNAKEKHQHTSRKANYFSKETAPRFSESKWRLITKK